MAKLDDVDPAAQGRVDQRLRILTMRTRLQHEIETCACEALAAIRSVHAASVVRAHVDLTPHRYGRGMRWGLAIALVLLGAIAIVGALVHRPGKPSAVSTTTTDKPKPDPNRVVTLPGPLPGGLLIADRGNDRIILVDPRRQTLWRFPTSQDRQLGRRLVYDDDTFVEPGGKALVTNEEENQDVLSIDVKTHAVTRLYGHPGVSGTGPGFLHTPDDAYVLPDGTMTVADAYNCRVLFIRHHRIVRQIGRTAVCVHNPPQTLGSVNSDTPLPDGASLSRRSTVPGLTASAAPGGCSARSRRRCRTRPTPSRSRAVGSFSRTTPSPERS
jgi:hypothetical protein